MEIALVVAVIAVIFVVQTLKIVPQQHAWVVERLGKYDRTLTPGLSFVVPFIERVAYKHSLKEVPLDVPSQVCITKDNTQLQVDGIIYFQITDPMRASYGSSNYVFAITQLAQTLLRSVIGKMELDKTFEERDAINASVVNALDEAAQNWGVKVLRYEIKDLTPPAEILRSMQAQITAEREKRALIAASEGRKQEQINIATGEREAFIARSEGERQAEINQAQGEASAIVAVADANAEAIRLVAEAIRSPGGEQAVQLKVAEKGGRGVRAAGPEEQHDDRAGQHDRGVRADRHGHDAASRPGRPDILRHRFDCGHPMMLERYEPAAIEPQAQAYWDDTRQFRRQRGRVAPEILLPVHVPVPERAPAHGARAQLHDRRRDHALHAHAGPQRAAADGLGRVRPARRKCGDGERRAAGEVDLRQHRAHEAATAVARLRPRLAARGHDLQARLLPLEPVAVPAHAREGHRVSQDAARELGSCRPDRARERAGHRRPRLAHRCARREARDPDVLPRDHRVMPTNCSRASICCRLAGARQSSCRPTGSAARKASKSSSTSKAAAR